MTAFSSHALALSFLLAALHADVGVAVPMQPNVVSEMPLSEEGYQQVAAMKSDGDMKEFIRRVLAKFGFQVADEGELSGFTSHYSGTNAVQDYQRLEEELRSVPWVQKNEAEELASPSVTPIDEVDVAAPRSMEGAARQAAHAKAASPKAAKKMLAKVAAAKQSQPKKQSPAKEEAPAHAKAKFVKAAPVAATSKAKAAAKRKDAPAETKALKGTAAATLARAAAKKAALPSRGDAAPALARAGAGAASLTRHALGARLEKGPRGAPSLAAERARASEAGGHPGKRPPAANAAALGRAVASF